MRKFVAPAIMLPNLLMLFLIGYGVVSPEYPIPVVGLHLFLVMGGPIISDLT